MELRERLVNIKMIGLENVTSYITRISQVLDEFVAIGDVTHQNWVPLQEFVS